MCRLRALTLSPLARNDLRHIFRPGNRPQLLQDGWVPVRETPMGGGTSSLAHSLILLEKGFPSSKNVRPRKPK